MLFLSTNDQTIVTISRYLLFLQATKTSKLKNCMLKFEMYNGVC